MGDSMHDVPRAYISNARMLYIYSYYLERNDKFSLAEITPHPPSLPPALPPIEQIGEGG